MTIISTPTEFQHPENMYIGKGNFLITEDYEFHWSVGGGVRKILRIVAPYEYNKASIPRFLWTLSPRDGEADGPSAFHDRLYQEKGVPTKGKIEYYTKIPGQEWQFNASKWSRKEVDELYSWMLVLAGLPEWNAKTQYRVLRCWPPLWQKF